MVASKLRFKEDDGSEFPEWEEKRLGDVTRRVTRRNKNTFSDIPLTISAAYGLIDQRKYFNKTVAAQDLSNYYLLKKGEFAYNRSSSAGYDFGAIKRLNMYDFGAVSTLYICFSIKEGSNVYSDYLSVYFDSNIWNKYAASVCAEGARNHGLLNISIEDFFGMPVRLPSLLEQKKIAAFLSTIDDIINQTQSELTAWEERKKGVMQKIFNREVRFKADDGSEFPEWEEKRLDDIAVVTMGQSPASSAYNTDCIGLPLVQGNADMTNRITTPCRYSSQVTKVANKGDIIMSVRAPVGVVGLASLDVCCGRGVCAIRVYDDYCQEYVYYLLLHLESSWKRIAQGGTFTAISKDDVCFLNVFIPSLPEQKKIADCLSSLDDVINQIKAELSAWKEFKKGLLQQMFV